MMKRTIVAIILIMAGAASAAKTDKTLVSWVALTSKGNRGGSVLTIQNGGAFDGIVFAELQSGKWMAGSNRFKRTEQNQNAYPAETADSKTLIQMAIVYKDDQITIYRNGEVYGSHKAENIDFLSQKGNIVVFGVRHIGAKSGYVSGLIEDARIYSKALSAEEIKALEPNKVSAIKPYAWWDFQGDKVVDRAGRFPHSKLSNGAKLADGKLVLSGKAVMVAASTKGDAGSLDSQIVNWPKNPPENWLTYHLAHPGPGRGWPGDPNPAFYYKGRYHLHYIYANRTGYVFAHVSSRDMVNWKWHPTVLMPPKTGHGMFSGTGLFTKEGKPVMIYHGQGSGKNWLAYGLDDNLDKWSRPEAVTAKTEDGQPAKIRYWDPDCWLNGDTYYALSGGKDPELMKSNDLKNWKYLGKLLHNDYPADLGVPRNEDISCANMFKIGNKWMLLCISHSLGCRYYLGDFKDEKYLPEFHAMMSWNGNNFFAPESMLAKDGRRVMWAWIMKGASPTAVQSLPRELELPQDGILRIRPLRELTKLRYDRKVKKGITLRDNTTVMLEKNRGDTLEIELKFKSPTAKEFGIDVLCDENGENGLRIAVIAESKTLRVGNVNAPFELKKGENLTLRVFVDKNLVEVFANDRQAVAAVHDKFQPQASIRLFSNGVYLRINKFTSWKMRSIYQGDTLFKGN